MDALKTVPETVPVLPAPPKFTAPTPLPKRMPPAPSVFVPVIVNVGVPVLKLSVLSEVPAHEPEVVTLMLLVEAVNVSFVGVAAAGVETPLAQSVPFRVMKAAPVVAETLTPLVLAQPEAATE